MEYYHARVLGSILVVDGAGGILATIIYEKHLEVLIGLCQDTIYAATQVLLGVIDGNND